MFSNRIRDWKRELMVFLGIPGAGCKERGVMVEIQERTDHREKQATKTGFDR